MPSHDRRAAGRRKAWGRGPTILRFEPLEGRPLLSAAQPDVVATAFNTVHNLDWGDTFHASGALQNRGAGDATAAFQVVVDATPAAGGAPVAIGAISIPAGLAAGASTTFDQVLRLPSSPIAGFDPSAGINLGLHVDPTNAVGESRTDDKQGLGPGVDESAVVIVPHRSARLVGDGFSVAPATLTWGGTMNITAQVANPSQGNAPATRARIVLTPAGATPGGPSDVTVGGLAVPPITTGSTATVSGTITLPATPPASLANASTLTVSMVQDATFAADPVGPHVAGQGAGLDSATVQIDPTSAAPGPLPDLTPTSVQAPGSLTWGQSFQVSTTVQNAGNVDAGPVTVRYLLADASGKSPSTLFLADATMPALKAQTSQVLTQPLTLPGRAPDELGLAVGAPVQVVVQIDPENFLDEINKTNNAAISSPITLTLVTADGTSLTPAPAGGPPAAAPVATTVTTKTTATAARQVTVHPAHPSQPKAPHVVKSRPLNPRLKPTARTLRIIHDATNKHHG